MENKITFLKQLIISFLILIVGFILSSIYKTKVFAVISLIIYGLIYTFHPMLPERFEGESKLKIPMRIIGIITLLYGIMLLIVTN